MREESGSPLGKTAALAIALARRSVLLVFGLAILLGVLSLPPGQEPNPSAPATDGQDYYQISQHLYKLNIQMKEKKKNEMALLAFRAPSGEEAFVVGYDNDDRTTFYNNRMGPVWVYLRTRKDGQVILAFEQLSSTAEFEFRQDEAGEVALTRQTRASRPAAPARTSSAEGPAIDSVSEATDP